MSGLTKEQMAMRRTGIGASEVSAVLGLPSFLSPLDVWRSKVEDFQQEDTADLRRGRVLEDAIAILYWEETGAALSSASTVRHPRCPVLLATPDRIARLGEREYPLEIKSVRGSRAHEFGEPLTDEVPQQYLVQVQSQMACISLPTADLAALVGGTDLRIFRFAIDVELEGIIIEGVERFWRDFVVTKRPPPVDASGAWAERLGSMARQEKRLEASPEMRAAAERLKAAKAAGKAAELAEKAARNELLSLMGDADGIEGLATYRLTKGRAVTDWKGICAEARVPAELTERFTTRNPYRQLRLVGGNDE